MKRILSSALALTLLLGTTGLAAAAPYNGNNRGGHYDSNGHNQDWRRGQRASRSDYSHWQKVDYRSHHLNRPRRGYEWRQTSDGRFVEIAIATGLIATILSAQ